MRNYSNEVDRAYDKLKGIAAATGLRGVGMDAFESLVEDFKQAVRDQVRDEVWDEAFQAGREYDQNPSPLKWGE